MYKYGLLILVLFLSTCECNGQSSIHEMDSEKWIEDLDYLAQQLPKRHANLYHTMPPQAFQEAVADLRERIPSLSNHEVMVEFVRLVAMVRDGHTDVSMQNRWYPVRLYFFGNGLYVTSATEPYRRAIGSRVLKIGALSVEDAVETVTPLIDRDNDVEVVRKAPVFLTMPEVLHSLHIIDDMQHAVFRLETVSHEVIELDLQPLETLEGVEWLRAPVLAGSPVPLSLQRRGDFYWYSYLPDSKTLYLKYNVCNDQEGKPSIKKFAKEMFEFVDRTPVQRFVVDLRDNPGGNFQKSRPIVEGIRKRSSINQKGHLFVITGRNTGSAATKTAAQLKTSTEAIIVGEDSRSNPNFSYNSEHFRLPNSRLEVGYIEELRRLFPELGDTVPIDVAVENTFEDYRSGRDRVLEAVLTYEQE